MAAARRAGCPALKEAGPTNNPPAPGRVLRLEDAGPDERALCAQLHHERRVGRRGDPACAEDDDGQLARLRDAAHDVERRLMLLRRRGELGLVERLQAADLAADPAQVADRLDDVAGAGLALGADHRRALADAAERLAEVGRAAYEGNLEAPLVDVV